MKFIGVDGCQKGWFLVSINKSGGWEFNLFSDIHKLWEEYQNSSLILIDIPIGLPSTTSRLCDVEARKLLSQRGSSVFPAPCWEAIVAKSYQEACQLNQQVLGKKISYQIWNIMPKIKEVNHFMSNLDMSTRGRIRESHPEICFWALGGGKPLFYSKKTERGCQERLAVLQNIYSDSDQIFRSAMEYYNRKELIKDDILDAMALAIVAASPSEMLYTIPPQPERDVKNLPMEIVYTNETILKE